MILSLLAGCGIEGLPYSPSQDPQDTNLESLLPFGQTPLESQETTKVESPILSQATENASDPSVQNKRKYIDIETLDNYGYHYDANFGLENDNLEDVFERLAPNSAYPRTREVIRIDQIGY